MTLAELKAVDKVFLKQLDEMPSLIDGYADLDWTLSLTVTEKKDLRVRRAAKMRELKGEESHVPRVPIIRASGVSDEQGEQGGESPVNVNNEIVSVRLMSLNQVLRIRSSKQLQQMPCNIDRSRFRWIRKSK